MAPTKHLAMAKNKVLQAKPVVAKPHKPISLHMELQEPLECPLCIEHLDDTDRHFFPCPCGYQVCLFCYQRLQNEYNNTCPGCRQQYSDDLDAVRQHIERKQKQAVEVDASMAGSSSMSHTAGVHGHVNSAHATHGGQVHATHSDHHTGHGVGQAAHASHSTHPYASYKVKQLVPCSSVAAKHRQHHELSAAPHARSVEAQVTGLPSSANWVAAAASATAGSHCNTIEPLQGLPSTTTDEESWPTLGVAASCSQHLHHKHDASVRRQSSSSSLASIQSQQHQQRHHHQQQPHHGDASNAQDARRSSCDSTSSSATEHLNDQTSSSAIQQGTQELDSRSSSGFMAVEVTTVVAGARHSVCVPVSNHTEVSALPEAVTLLDMLQQAVNGSKLSSTEAAVQLVQCLRKLEAGVNQKQQRAWLDKALAHRKSAATRNCTEYHSARPGGGTAASGAAAIGRPPAAPCSTRAPPPGFGHHPRTAGGAYVPHLQQQAGLTFGGTSAVRSTPHRPVAAAQAQALATQSDNYTSQSSMRSVDSEGSLFSQGSGLSQSAGLWTDSGLPGLDFGAAVGGLNSNVASIPAAVPARLQMLWAGGSNQTDRASTAGSGCVTPSVPPGFGVNSTVGLGGSRLYGGNNSKLLSGSYEAVSCADLRQAGSQVTGVAPTSCIGQVGLEGGNATQQQHALYGAWE